MSRRVGFLLASMVAMAWAPCAADAQLPNVELRAVGRVIPERLVQYVAQHADPTTFAFGQRPELAKLTLKGAAENLCGTVQDGYLQEVRAKNSLARIDETSALGDTAYAIAWPACLYVGKTEGRTFTYVPLETETLGDIRELFTGVTSIDDNARDLVGITKNTPVDDFLPFRSVPITFWTQPTPLRVRDPATFIGGVQALGVGLVESRTGAPTIAGRLFDTPLLEDAPSRFPCDSASRQDYPFNPSYVAAAFTYSRTHASVDMRFVPVIIADNGFYGVDCDPANKLACPKYDNGGKLQFLPRFPSIYFGDGSKGEVGPTLLKFAPVNYGLNVPVSPSSAHGTHVAGLTLGGPLLEKTANARKAIFGFDTKAWIQLSIANMGGGQETFGADEMIRLMGFLNGSGDFKIVNMSVSFEEGNSPLAKQIERQMGNIAADTLYVVAAGNRSTPDDVEARSFPARIGGDNGARLTVFTVASIDADRRISSFSKYSRKAVDIAAPGCKISSWLEARPASVDVRMSGTSQATPLVTWASAMVSSLYKLSPAEVKARIVYSGDIITLPQERAKTRHGVELNIPKSLFLFDDLLTYRDAAGKSRTLLGTLKQVAGIACNGLSDMDWEQFRSFKRTSDASYLYAMEDLGLLTSCPGTMRTSLAGGGANQVMFTATHEVIDDPATGYVRPVQMTLPPIPVTQVDEIVRRIR